MFKTVLFVSALALGMFGCAAESEPQPENAPAPPNEELAPPTSETTPKMMRIHPPSGGTVCASWGNYVVCCSGSADSPEGMYCVD